MAGAGEGGEIRNNPFTPKKVGAIKDLILDLVSYIFTQKVVVIRLHNKDRCYIAPFDQKNDTQRKLELINEELSEALIEQLAGVDALRFCRNQQTFLLKEPENTNAPINRRRRRQALTNPLDLPIEQRTPNCMDLLLDCGRQIGEVNDCYTWINGAMAMHRQCLSDSEFKVTIAKPKGRIAKIQEQQWKICEERRREGLRC
ncbi:hypothetical protein Tcan_11749 [Toxocara canis]|uniref:Uncharacterized protein n=1 Tax=Toxocara canis TaxID=6265 RepID=A0A0B2UVS8_TOXCA|nr:hypothetical protein Tcan_11749 [Toxocara canis]